jgi:sphinganine-1-phosphate aldolase
MPRRCLRQAHPLRPTSGLWGEIMSIKLPEKGTARERVLSRLRALKDNDSDWKSGRMFGLIYHPGEEIEEFAKDACYEFLIENGLSPFAFPSLLRMETEVISMVAHMLSGDEKTMGSITSGGTESIFMAVKTARDWASAEKPEITEPEIVMPLTAHPAFNKAAHYLGLRVIVAPVDDGFRAVPDAMREAVNENTIMLVGSAFTYPHGMVDPISDIASLADERGIWMHVDSCLGGFILPFMKKLDYPIPPFDFALPGVCSISCDIHKYGYTPKGISTVLYRSSDLRQYQYFAYADWPGGVYGTSSLSGARSGGALASAWAVMNHLGEEGYLRLVKTTVETTRKLIEGIGKIPGLYVLGEPDATVFAFGSDTVNVYALSEEMKKRGWHLEAQHLPPCLHVTVSPVHERIVKPFLKDLGSAVKAVSALKPEDIAGDAAMYGMIGTMPDRKQAKEFAVQYLNDLYRVK